MERFALIEAVAQFTRALDQVASLPATPAQRREQILHQVGLANALYHTKGFAAVGTKAAFDKARMMIEQVERLGEHVEDPLLLYSVLYGFFIAKFIVFDGDAACALARQFLALAERQKMPAPIMIGHRLLANTLLCMGDASEGLSHLDRALALYDPAVHRPLATRFGHDVRVATLTFRPLALWLLGYPKTALMETDRAIAAARETGHVPTLLFALALTALTHICCKDHAAATAHLEECIAFAQEEAPYMKYLAAGNRGCILAQTGKASEAIQAISDAITELRPIGATVWRTACLAHLSLAYAELGKLDDAWRCIGEATTAAETAKERWFEVEVHRIAGELALIVAEPRYCQSRGVFRAALTIARKQKAKSWELSAATSMGRLWRDQGKMRQARDLLAPVYGWFSEGFDTRDLKEAKALLEELT